ncbi:hypothetical protein VTN49DRAFT_4197 [Thermomyces lanuginosus]|uniref:uncharacterized protein n=1 Tax=Thermomyces lanuginosus TaxID=5541 RepID=UPI003741F83A
MAHGLQCGQPTEIFYHSWRLFDSRGEYDAEVEMLDLKTGETLTWVDVDAEINEVLGLLASDRYVVASTINTFEDIILRPVSVA